MNVTEEVTIHSHLCIPAEQPNDSLITLWFLSNEKQPSKW